MITASDQYKENLSAWVKNEQQAKGLSDREFAEALGVNRTTIYCWRSKSITKRLKAENLRAIASYLGCSETFVERHLLDGLPIPKAAPKVEVESAILAIQSVPAEALPRLLEAVASRMRHTSFSSQEVSHRENFFCQPPDVVSAECKLSGDKPFDKDEPPVSERFRRVLSEAVDEAGGVDAFAASASRYLDPGAVQQFLDGTRLPVGQEILNLSHVLKNPATGLPDLQWLLDLLGYQINNSDSHISNGC